jgi:hypothetical protein
VRAHIGNHQLRFRQSGDDLRAYVSCGFDLVRSLDLKLRKMLIENGLDYAF